MIGRRGFITGLVSLVAAPAIVRVGSIMPVKAMIEPAYGIGPAMYAVLSSSQYNDLIREAMSDLVAFGSVSIWTPSAPYAEGDVIRIVR